MISVNIIARNEEKNITDCIDNVIDWVDEVVIADDSSTDRTAELCKRDKVRFYSQKWDGRCDLQRAFALEQSKSEWILALDADERISPELKEEILGIVKNPPADFSGFNIPRKSYFLDKWISQMGWYPGYQLRFFRKSKVSVTDRLVHEGYIIDGQIGTLKHDMIHYSVDSVEHFSVKITRYALLQAKEKLNRKPVGFSDIFLRPIATLLRSFISQKGYKDGIHGLMVAYFDAITNSLTYMNLWDLQNKEKQKK